MAGRKDVEDAAADGELADAGDEIGAVVAVTRQVLDHLLDRVVLADARASTPEANDARDGRRRCSARGVVTMVGRAAAKMRSSAATSWARTESGTSASW